LSIPDLVLCVVNVKGSSIIEHIKKYTKSEVVEVLHGLPDVMHRDTYTRMRYKEKLGINDKFTILLFGFIRRAKGYEYILRAVKKIIESKPSMKDKIRVILSGVPILPEDQVYLNYLRELGHNLGLEDIILIIPKYLDKDEVDMFFGAADMTVLSYTCRVGPSGVLSYALAYEVPSVIICDNKYFTQQTNVPALVVNLDTDEIALAILKLMTNRNDYTKQIQRIMEYKANNNNRNIALLYNQIYKKLYSESTNQCECGMG
jgi:glycosyltransferase involved in cell wall biosynthesis